MLCLGRKFGEWIVIEVGGVRFRLTVEARPGDHDPIGVIFDAPPEVRIYREEVARRLEGGPAR